MPLNRLPSPTVLDALLTCFNSLPATSRQAIQQQMIHTELAAMQQQTIQQAISGWTYNGFGESQFAGLLNSQPTFAGMSVPPPLDYLATILAAMREGK